MPSCRRLGDLSRRLPFLLAFAFALGCAHRLDRDARSSALYMPPTAEELRTKPNALNVRWYQTFKAAEQAAKTPAQKQKACELYRQLAATPEFPLAELANLRSFQVCTESLPPSAWRNKLDSSYVFLQDLVKALETQWSSLSDDDKIVILWERAKIEKDERKKEGFFSDAVQLALKSKSSKRLEEAQQRLYANSPRLKPNLAPEDFAAVAADLRKWRDFRKSVEFDKQRLNLSGLSDEERFQILKTIRQTWKSSQHKNEMLIATTELVNFARNSFRNNRNDAQAAKRLLEARLLFARTVWTENRRSLAIKTLNETRRELSGRLSLEEVYFVLGHIEGEAGELNSAAGFFEMALAEKPSTPGIREKTRWSLAWTLHKLGKKDAALKTFQEIIDESREPAEKSRARFWAARNMPKGTPRTQLLRTIQKEDPIGYYAVLASRELGETLPPLPRASVDTSLKLTRSTLFEFPPALQTEWLLALDLNDLALNHLAVFQAELRRTSAPLAGWLSLSSAYARAGKYLPLFSMLSSLPPEQRESLLQNTPLLLFPLSWLEEIESAAKKTRVPPELLLAIIRQESAFDPRARSPSEAYGLTQMLPSVAYSLSQRYKLGYKTPEDLFDPAMSIRLGARELRQLLRRWNNQWIPTVASYNASQDAVRTWLKVRHRDDPLEFIEEIPYEETRGYVKLILRNQVFYQRLLAKDATRFPEKCLQIKHK